MRFLTNIIAFFFSMRSNEVQNSMQLAVRSTSLRELDRMLARSTRLS